MICYLGKLRTDHPQIFRKQALYLHELQSKAQFRVFRFFGLPYLSLYFYAHSVSFSSGLLTRWRSLRCNSKTSLLRSVKSHLVLWELLFLMFKVEYLTGKMKNFGTNCCGYHLS